MARKERILSARSAIAATKPGRHSDGGGLYLDVAKTGRRSWVWLFAWQGRQREMGLGAFPQTPLAEARESRDTSRNDRTFGACAGELLATKSSQWRNDKHRGQWRTTLETYAAPIL